MNTASLENCKRLYELSKWDATEHHYLQDGVNDGVSIQGRPGEDGWELGTNIFLAYDAGYLLRKLPQAVEVEGYKYGLTLALSGIGHVMWGAGYEHHFVGGVGETHTRMADTPEDALCLLAIKLFEEGILTHE